MSEHKIYSGLTPEQVEESRARHERTVVRAIAAVVVAAVIGLVLWAIFKPSPPAPGLPVVEDLS